MLQPAPGRTVYDATFGRGGHTRAFLDRGARVVALDVDPAAEAEAKRLQAEVGSERFRFHRVNFSELGSVVSQEGQADGLLLDLGISSPQVDHPHDRRLPAARIRVLATQARHNHNPLGH